jgi:lipopolysaccharide biosynthesis glycosyltransferase
MNKQDQKSSKSKYCIFLAGSVTHNWDFVKYGMRTTIKSCKKTNPDIPIFSIVDDDSPAVKKALEGSELILIDPTTFKESIREDLGIGAYFRFLVHQIKGYDKALYIDGDTVVLGDLKPLFSTEGRLLARRFTRNLNVDFVDSDMVMAKEKVTQQSLAMNNGVILFDMAYWSDGKILEDLLSIAEEYGWTVFKNPDQGFSNIICWRRGIKDVLPDNYNTFAGEVEKASDLHSIIGKNGVVYPCIKGKEVKIVHFIGPVKPWHLARQGYIPFTRKYFQYYAQFLPWYERIWQNLSCYPNYFKRKLKSWASMGN